MTRIAIVIGSTRPGRKGPAVASWALERLRAAGGADYAVLDVADFGLPFLDEALPPMRGQYAHDHTRRWAAAVAPFDGFVFVTPEYNRMTSPALLNAIDALYAEWRNKAAAIVSYGVAGGLRAADSLRQVLAPLDVAVVGAEVNIGLFTDFDTDRNLAPAPAQDAALQTMRTQLLAWSGALSGLRQPASS